MTLRGMLGSDVQRFQKQINDLLDGEDGFIVLFNGSRLVSYAQGFGVSPCQLELLTVEIERALRNVIGGQSLTNRRNRRNRRNREKSKRENNRGAGAGLFQHLGRSGRGHHSGVVDIGSESVRPGDPANSHGGRTAGRVLRLASEAASSSAG
jgi:hypothetical protein